MIKIDDRFSMSVDNYNHTLRDNNREYSRRNSYFSNIEGIANCIAERLNEDTLRNGEVDPSKYLSNLIVHHSPVEELIEELGKKLKVKLEKLIQDLE